MKSYWNRIGVFALILVAFAFIREAQAQVSVGFSNPSLITIPATGTGTGTGAPATPYPSSIAVWGVSGTIAKTTLTLNGLHHTYPSDVDVLLVSPSGAKIIVMSDVGIDVDVTNVTLTLDDTAATSLPTNSALSSGTYKTTNLGAGDAFPSPAPASPYTNLLADLSGSNPNGTWSLYIVDDASGDTGAIAGGWSLTLTLNTKVWDGGGANNFWSNPTNWAGNVAPVAGDALIFPAGASRATNTNDFASGFNFNSIVFGGSNYVVSGNSVTLASGIMATNKSGTNTVSLPITLPATQNFAVSNQSVLALNGVIGGAAGAGLTKIGPGTLMFGGTAANTYPGITSILEGTNLLAKTAGITAIPGILNIGDGNWAPVVKLGTSDQIANTSAITMARFSTFDLNNNSDTVGALDLLGCSITTGSGTLTLNGDVTATDSIIAGSVTISGKLSLGGATRTFNVYFGSQSSSLNISAVISDGGSSAGIIKTGTEALQLSGANTYTGATTVNDGVLDVHNPAALGGTGTGTTLNNASQIILYGYNIGAEPLTINSTNGSVFTVYGTNSWSGPIALNNPCSIYVANTNDMMTFSGAISGNFGVSAIGAGTLVLSGSTANTYSGSTIMNGGTLLLSKSPGVTAVPGALLVGQDSYSITTAKLLAANQIANTSAVTVDRGCTLDLNNNSDVIGALTLIFGAAVNTGVGTLTLGGNVYASGSTTYGPATFNGKLSLGGATRTFTVEDSAFGPPGLIMNAIISDGGSSAGLIKNDTGTMQLLGASSFSGAVVVDAGGLDVHHDLALGAATGGVTINTNAWMMLNNVSISGESLVVNGTNSYSQWQCTGVNLWDGPINLNTTCSISLASTNESLTLDGSISGSGGISSLGSGTLTLGGSTPNSYSGQTYLDSGLLMLSKSAGVTAIAGVLHIGSSETVAKAQLTSANQIADNVAVTVDRGGLLDLNNNAETIGSLTMYYGGGVNNGSATLTVGGDVYGSGSTTYGPAYINGNLSLGGATRTFTAEDSAFGPPGLLIMGAISNGGASAGLIKAGFGGLEFEGSSPNAYSGTTVINSGLLQLNKSANVTAVPGDLVIGDGVGGPDADIVVAYADNQFANSFVTITSSGQMSVSSGSFQAFGALSGTGDLSLVGASITTGNNNASTAFDGKITGTGSIAKNGSGTMTLSNTNSYTLTTINSGTVLVNGSQPTSQVNINSGAVLGGSGQVGAIIASNGGKVSPGNSPGTLSSSNTFFNAGSIFAVELKGSASGSYDQLNVTGAVNLGSMTLQVSYDLGSTAPGTSFVIINNDGADAVSGTFSGLPEGSTFYVSGQQFRISYVGGTGNDVVLTQLPLQNLNPISIPAIGNASTYPSTIVVSNMIGNVENVSVTLSNVAHTFPDDIDILLVGPGGQNVILMSDAGGSGDITNVVLTFDANATNSLSDSNQIISGTFLPSNFDTNDTFSSPAPLPPYGSTLSAFKGTSPNGTWSLYIVDDAGGDSGSISGWSLNITVAPALKILQSGGNAVLSWPNGFNGYALESSSTMLSNSWSSVLTPPVVVTNNCVVTNGLSSGYKFYRLKK